MDKKSLTKEEIYKITQSIEVIEIYQNLLKENNQLKRDNLKLKELNDNWFQLLTLQNRQLRELEEELHKKG